MEETSFSGQEGCGNLEKELLANSVPKMKPNVLDLGENMLHQSRLPGREVGVKFT